MTVAQASSSISRRNVCSQLSPGSGRPAGRSQIVPSGLITTMSPSAVTQTPSAPCGVPSGGSGGGCHDTSHCWPPDQTGICTPSAATAPSAIISTLACRRPLFLGLSPGAVEPQVPHRTRVEVDAQAGGVAVAGGEFIRGGKRAGAEPQLVIWLAAVREGAAESRGDAVGAHVAVPGPVQARQAGVDVEVGPAYQGELAGRGVRTCRPVVGQGLAHVGDFGADF